MKLHLGCGERYLEGYINIDFPTSEHTVQKSQIADRYEDLRVLRFEKGTIDEVRLHHVFEHFPRHAAVAMLSAWYLWLKPSGRLWIEVPDLGRASLAICNPFLSKRKRTVAERHLFGSHEAGWAVHCEGYTKNILSGMLTVFDFKVEKVKQFNWKGTHNLEVLARRGNSNFGVYELEQCATKYLESFLVDESESELRLLNEWLSLYRNQFSKNFDIQSVKSS